MRKVAVLFGGKSCEQEISVLTGVFALNLMDRERYVPVPVYLHTDGKMYTSKKMFSLKTFEKKDFSSFERIFFDGGGMYALNEKRKRVKPLGRIDAALNCCHGGLGEGGGVSALMELNEIPLASPKLTASGVFLDKALTKLIAKALNVPTVEYIRVNERDYQKRGKFLLKTVASKLKYPVIVKPAHLGSSIGIVVAKDEDALKAALEQAFTLDCRVVVEKFLKNKLDVNCAAYLLGGEICVSEVEEAASGGGVYSFEEKYMSRSGGGLLDGNLQKGGGRVALNGELREKIRGYTKTLYKRMDLRGVVRMDFLVSEGKAYLGEVNTVPGSLAYYLFCERVSDGKRFLTDLIEEAFLQFEAERKTVISTGILQSGITDEWRK